MVCTGVNVSMPDYTSLRSAMTDSRFFDFGALKYSLKLDFKETEFLTKETYGFTDHKDKYGESDDDAIIDRGDGYRTTETIENATVGQLADAEGWEIRYNGIPINNPSGWGDFGLGQTNNLA